MTSTLFHKITELYTYFHEIKIKILAFLNNNRKLFTLLGLPFFLMNLSMFHGQTPRPHLLLHDLKLRPKINYITHI
jgi:hypothetical protein